MALFTDPEGDGFTQSAIDDDGGDGLNSLLTITASYTGTHVIGVTATGGAVAGDYTLYAIPRDSADEPDTFAGAVSLTHGGIYYGFIDFVPSVGARPYGKTFGEVDTFKITVEAGKAYTIEVSGGADYLSDFRRSRRARSIPTSCSGGLTARSSPRMTTPASPLAISDPP